MKKTYAIIILLFGLMCEGIVTHAQQSAAMSAGAVPSLVNFSGVLTNSNGRPLTKMTGVTFSIYAEPQSGSPLWLETQNVQPDAFGHYTVELGATTGQGLPATLFADGQARWLEVQVQGQDPLGWVMLVSVPYALKAGDAQTLGGKPVSSFMLAPAGKNAGSPNNQASTITGGGTTDYVPLWLSATKLGSSKLFQSTAGDLGIATTSPAAKLDVNGTSAIRNTLTLFPTGSSPTLSVSGTAFQVSSNGKVTFVSGQTFPGTGDGTVTGVTAGTDLTGGGKSGDVTLNLDTTKVPLLAANNTFIGTQTINNNVTVTAAGTTLTASGGTVSVYAAPASNAGTGVYGTTNAGTAIYGTSGSGAGVFGNSNSSYAVYGTSNTGTAVYGDSASADGIQGISSGTSAGNLGVSGIANGSTGNVTYGVLGNNIGSNYGVGVYGQDSTTGIQSSRGEFIYGTVGIGVWGDGGSDYESDYGNVGVLGTADDNIAVWAENASGSAYTLFAINDNNEGYPFYAGNSLSACYIDDTGDINCTGTKNAVVPVDGGQRKVALSAIESPKNWFEDAGSTQLVDGFATVSLDSVYRQTVNTEAEYQVFLTPYGDCKGLYVSNRTANSFEVHELEGGRSTLSFGYRIMALRRNYENVRFADHTNDPDPRKMMAKRGTGAPLKLRQIKPSPKPAAPPPPTQLIGRK
jgi:hypothetical protein